MLFVILICAIICILGDHFRSLWGPFAGWAQSVSLVSYLAIDIAVSLSLCPSLFCSVANITVMAI